MEAEKREKEKLRAELEAVQAAKEREEARRRDEAKGLYDLSGSGLAQWKDLILRTEVYDKCAYAWRSDERPKGRDPPCLVTRVSPL